MKKEYEIQVEIGSSCLLNCAHCSSYDMRMMGEDVFSEEAVISFITRFQGPVYVYLTGGDPVLYPNLLSFCKRLSESKKDLSIGLYTTGNCAMMKPISKAFSNQLSQAGVVDCYLSIYHSDSEVHDLFTGKSESFDNTISSVKNLKNVGIHPKAHLVLFKKNQNDLDQVIRFCEGVGFEEVRILKLINTGNAKNNWNDIGISATDQDAIITSLIKRKSEFNIKLSFSGFPNYHACRAMEHSQKCQAGTNLLYITLSGDVYPCACTVKYGEQYHLGNINDPQMLIQQIETVYPNEYNQSCLNRSNE